MSRKGFTLAEVLVTLAVIGIVASITIPPLVKNYNENQYKKKWKKTFADICNATNMLRADAEGDLSKALFVGANNINSYSSAGVMKNLYVKHFKVIKSCDPNSYLGICWNSYGAHHKTTGVREPYTGWWSWEQAGVILNNGISILFMYKENYDCTDSSECGRIFVDVNGLDEPNTWGIDIFQATIYKNKIKPFPDVTGADSCDSPGSGKGCSGRYLIE